MSDDNSTKDITAFVLPLDPDKLLLPNSSIAEVVSVATMIPVAKKPTWFLGKLGWHGRTVPIVSFGRLNDNVDRLRQFKHAAIIRGGNHPEELPVFAVALNEPPKMYRLTKADLISVEAPVGVASLAIVEVAGQQVTIPNVEFIEEKILAELT